MKIRSGFVSNSSSTSFCIVGMEIENHDEFLDKYLVTPEKRDTIAEDFPWSLETGGGLTTFCEPYNCVSHIGRDIMSMKDTETLADFKQSVVDILREKGLEVPISDVGIISEGWFDG